jgi:hypothetical protein
VTANGPGSGTPSGTVTFKDGPNPISCSGGSQTLNNSGQATCPIVYSSTGSHSITAVYGGDGSFAGSTSPPISLTIGQASTTTSVSSSLNPSLVGQQVTYTATVSVNAPGSGTPTGSVQFLDSGNPIAACIVQPLNASKTATCNQTYIISGGHTITAQYSGDGNFSVSTSVSFSQWVGAAGGPTLTLSTPSETTNANQRNETFSGTTTVKTGTVTIQVYAGSTTTGAPVATYTVSNFGTSSPFTWSTTKPALPPGTYTAQATQIDGSGNGSVNAPTATFNVT